MEGAATKPKSRRRPARKAEAAATGAAGTTAAGAAAGARPAATANTDATAADEAPQPKPSLSQRVAQSLRQLSQLGTTSKAEVRALGWRAWQGSAVVAAVLAAAKPQIFPGVEGVRIKLPVQGSPPQATTHFRNHPVRAGRR